MPSGASLLILTLQHPFTGETIKEILEKVVSGKIASPAHLTAPRHRRPAVSSGPSPCLKHLPGGRVPEALSAVAMKALATRPADRYQTVPDLQKELEAYQGGFATSAERAGLGKQLVLLVKRHRTASAAAAAIVLLSGAFTAKVIATGQRAERSMAELRETAPAFEAQSRALLAEGKLDEALSKIGYAATLAPEHAEYLLARAHLLESTQRLPEAAQEYRRVLEQRPDDAAAKLNLALCERLLAEKGAAPRSRSERKTSCWTAWWRSIETWKSAHSARFAGAARKPTRRRSAPG